MDEPEEFLRQLPKPRSYREILEDLDQFQEEASKVLHAPFPTCYPEKRLFED